MAPMLYPNTDTLAASVVDVHRLGFLPSSTRPGRVFDTKCRKSEDTRASAGMAAGLNLEVRS